MIKNQNLNDVINFKAILRKMRAAKIGIFILTLCALFISSLSFAVNPQSWLKNVGKQRVRKVTHKQTTIAAVRGVDEPSEVDPTARDLDGVKKMETRNLPSEKVDQFIAEGKLVKTKIEPSPSQPK